MLILVPLKKSLENNVNFILKFLILFSEKISNSSRNFELFLAEIYLFLN
jgi:hypothetical protein